MNKLSLANLTLGKIKLLYAINNLKIKLTFHKRILDFDFVFKNIQDIYIHWIE